MNYTSSVDNNSVPHFLQYLGLQSFKQEDKNENDKTCFKCNKTFKSQRILNVHLRKHNKINEKIGKFKKQTAKIKLQKKLRCKFCDIVYLSISGYDKHIKKYHGKQTFGDILRNFKTKLEFDECTSNPSCSRKMRRLINGEFVVYFTCNINNCSQIFWDNEQLKKHRSEKHLDNLCQVCFEFSKNKYILLKHLRKSHDIYKRRKLESIFKNIDNCKGTVTNHIISSGSLNQNSHNININEREPQETKQHCNKESAMEIKKDHKTNNRKRPQHKLSHDTYKRRKLESIVKNIDDCKGTVTKNIISSGSLNQNSHNININERKPQETKQHCNKESIMEIKNGHKTNNTKQPPHNLSHDIYKRRKLESIVKNIDNNCKGTDTKNIISSGSLNKNSHNINIKEREPQETKQHCNKESVMEIKNDQKTNNTKPPPNKLVTENKSNDNITNNIEIIQSNTNGKNIGICVEEIERSNSITKHKIYKFKLDGENLQKVGSNALENETNTAHYCNSNAEKQIKGITIQTEAKETLNDKQTIRKEKPEPTNNDHYIIEDKTKTIDNRIKNINETLNDKQQTIKKEHTPTNNDHKMENTAKLFNNTQNTNICKFGNNGKPYKCDKIVKMNYFQVSNDNMLPKEELSHTKSIEINEQVDLEKNKFYCILCNKNIVGKKMYQEHNSLHFKPLEMSLYLKYESLDMLPCIYWCGEPPTELELMKKHMLQHLGKTETCKICLNGPYSHLELKQHNCLKHDQVECKFCNHYFSGSENYVKHLKEIHFSGLWGNSIV